MMKLLWIGWSSLRMNYLNRNSRDKKGPIICL